MQGLRGIVVPPPLFISVSERYMVCLRVAVFREHRG